MPHAMTEARPELDRCIRDCLDCARSCYETITHGLELLRRPRQADAYQRAPGLRASLRDERQLHGPRIRAPSAALHRVR